MKKQPYQYVIIKHDSSDNKVYLQGITVAEDMYGAYKNIGTEFLDVNDQDAEQLEVFVKPFLKDESCPTKKDFGGIYSVMLDNNLIYFRSSTASMDDFIPNTFTTESNYMLPDSMYLIDIFNLIKNNKKNLI